MYPKHTEPFPCTHLNGRALSFAPALTASPSTQVSALVAPQPQDHMETWLMQGQMSSDLRALAPYQNGWMIIFSFTYSRSILQNTTTCVEPEPSPSKEMAADWLKGDATGTTDPYYLTTMLKSLMRTLPFPSLTYPLPLPAPAMMPVSRTASMTLIDCHTSLASPGNPPRIYPFPHAYHSSGSCGTWIPAQFQFQKPKERSTWPQSRNGKRRPLTPCRKPNSFMENFSMHPLYSLPGKPTWYPLKPCFPSTVTVLTCLVPPQKTPAVISTGGKPDSHSRTSHIPSQGQSKSLTSRLTQTLVQALASRSGSTARGEHGGSSQGGTQMDSTSAGLRPSEWNSSLVHSLLAARKTHASKSMGITGASSKVGGRGAAATKQPTPSSSISTKFQPQQNAPSSLATFPVPTTQRMIPPMASTPPLKHLLPPIAIPAPLQGLIVDFDAPMLPVERIAKTAGSNNLKQIKPHAPTPAHRYINEALRREGEDLFKASQI